MCWQGSRTPHRAYNCTRTKDPKSVTKGEVEVATKLNAKAAEAVGHRRRGPTTCRPVTCFTFETQRECFFLFCHGKPSTEHTHTFAVPVFTGYVRTSPDRKVMCQLPAHSSYPLSESHHRTCHTCYKRRIYVDITTSIHYDSHAHSHQCLYLLFGKGSRDFMPSSGGVTQTRGFYGMLYSI